MKQQALGLIETRGLVAAIEAADAALKTAAVELVTYEKVTGGLVTIAVTGEVAAVQAAVSAGSAAAAKVGQLISQHVIPRPLADIRLLIKRKDAGPEPGAPEGGNPVADGEPDDGPDGGVPMGDVPAGDGSVSTKDKRTKAARTIELLESLSVEELRRLARNTEGIAIKGRRVSKANKGQLISEIMRAKKTK